MADAEDDVPLSYRRRVTRTSTKASFRNETVKSKIKETVQIDESNKASKRKRIESDNEVDTNVSSTVISNGKVSPVSNKQNKNDPQAKKTRIRQSSPIEKLTNGNSKSMENINKSLTNEESGSEDEKPLSQRINASKKSLPPAVKGKSINKELQLKPNEGSGIFDPTLIDEDSVPLSQRKRTKKNQLSKTKEAKDTEEEYQSDTSGNGNVTKRRRKQSDSEMGVNNAKPQTNGINHTPSKQKKIIKKPNPQNSSEIEDELAIKSKKNGSLATKPKSVPKKGGKSGNGSEQKPDRSERDYSSEEDHFKTNGKKVVKQDKSKGGSSKAASKSKTSNNTKGKEKRQESLDDDEEGEDDEYKWWKENNAQADGTVKWNTLEHTGVLFPPEYVPHGVRMKFHGAEVYLEPEAEEVASFYAAMLNTEHLKNETFNRNFFEDWVAILKKSTKNPPIRNYDKDFKHCDFTPIFEYFESEKERKKSMTKEEKKKVREDKAKLDEQYEYCFLDGRKEKVGNFRIEPPGLFRGRGQHPKTGRLKARVRPESVTINIGKNAKVPSPPPGHKWGGVVHDNTVTWLATWKENVNDAIKYVFLAANSSLKGQSDLKKFEKARELKQHVKSIREDYTRDLKDKLMETRQRATAMYLIDRFALRAGNEKDDKNEADTVGCCSLRLEHITLTAPNTVLFDFLGKDSIQYKNEVTVDDQVFKNLGIFKRKPKTKTDLLFDRLNTTSLNKHLSTYMAGLTAKVFRTYNASHTFQIELNKNMNELQGKSGNLMVPEKIVAYNSANREVAVLCNHQRTVGKGHESQMSKIQDKIRALKYQRMKLKRAILTQEPKLKSKRPDLLQEESDLENEWILQYEKQLMEKEREKARAKFEKDNEKLIAEKQKPKPEKELKAILQEIDRKEKELAKELKTRKVELKRGQTIEKINEQLKKINEKIIAAKLMQADKEKNKETALGTSKINYIDPRISAAWCYKYDVPIEKIFTKSLRDKFKWAFEVDADWEF
ncbi:hypothetical protein G9A89_015029 [Geosiphon pyriformis]|nr:hypothetical protein G9A89_015029 [Geosiphon pyriformis]